LSLATCTEAPIQYRLGGVPPLALKKLYVCFGKSIHVCRFIVGGIQWRPSVKRVDELGGYEKLWKARTTHIPIKDSLGPLATRPPFTEVNSELL
jgi:hypothetical protein